MNYRIQTRELADAILSILSETWHGTGTELVYANCFELLVAVILSAQCTDDQVNRVTPLLFKTWPDAESLAEADINQLEKAVYSTGFYHHKARNIKESARKIRDEYRGEVPQSFEELLKLPGVGRKTAHLVMSLCFNEPGLIIDTHVLRIAKRTGLALTQDPYKMEVLLGGIIPRKQHAEASFALNRQAKFICTARKPNCEECSIARCCLSVSPENFSA